MSSLLFYREQAAQQQAAADSAALANVRERCQRAADAWEALALRSERADNARTQAASDKALAAANEQSEDDASTAQPRGDAI